MGNVKIKFYLRRYIRERFEIIEKNIDCV